MRTEYDQQIDLLWHSTTTSSI